LPRLLTKECFGEFIKEIYGLLKPLFEGFLAAQIMTPKVINCKSRPGVYCNDDRERRPAGVKILKYLGENSIVPGEDVIRYFSSSSFVSKSHGKFLLFYVWNKLKFIFKDLRQIELETLKVRLAQGSASANMQQLVNSISGVGQSNGIERK
jgi:hypothetical protein